MSLKKGFLVMSSTLLLVSLIAACSKEAEGPTTATATPGASAGPKYPASLTYWIKMDPDTAVSLKSYGDLEMYKELEKRTGTKVEFQHPASAQYQDQFKLMMATGTLPDVIYYTWEPGVPDKAIKDGRILRLNEIIEKYAPNLTQLLKEKPHIRKLITTDEGNIYAFPFIAVDPVETVYSGLIVRKDWLDKLNLKEPVTIDDWEKMLIAFRDKDPNGNGKKDEIPYMHIPGDVKYSHAFMGAFGVTAGFYQENNVVKYGPAQPGFKDYLTLMNRWYKEGLMDKDYLTSNTKLNDAKMLDDKLGSMLAWAGSGLGKYVQLKKETDPSFKVMGVRFPVLKEGTLPLSRLDSPVNGSGAAISATAKNPEQIAAWLDYNYSKEGSVLNNFGVEGKSYTMVNGKPQYSDYILKNPNKLSVSQALATVNQITGGGPFAADKEASKQFRSDPEQNEAMAKWLQADHSKELPPFSLNADEQSRFVAIMNDLNTYKDEMMNKFIMGAEPLSKFEEYQATLKKLGIEKAIQIQQDAYNRYLKK